MRSLAAGMATYLPLGVLAAYSILSPAVTISGIPDNAPRRAGYVLLMIAPMLILVFSLYHALKHMVLSRLHMPSRWHHVLVDGVVGLAGGLVMATQEIHRGMLTEGALSVVFMGGLVFASLAVGSLAFMWKQKEVTVQPAPAADRLAPDR